MTAGTVGRSAQGRKSHHTRSPACSVTSVAPTRASSPFTKYVQSLSVRQAARDPVDRLDEAAAVAGVDRRDGAEGGHHGLAWRNPPVEQDPVPKLRVTSSVAVGLPAAGVGLTFEWHPASTRASTARVAAARRFTVPPSSEGDFDGS